MRKPKNKRNDLLIKFRNEGWTYARLAKRFKFNSAKTAYDLYQYWAVDKLQSPIKPRK